MAEFYFGTLEEHVLNGHKPGALIAPETDDIRGEMEHFKSIGLEVWPAMPYNTTILNMAVALPRPAGDILRDIELGPIAKKYETKVTELAGKIGWMSVAHSLATLSGLPRHAPHNFEDPEVAILDGALLGYEPCCTDQYIGTIYLGQPRDPASTAVMELETFDEWVNPHVLCRDCAAEFPTEL
jgi:hypothetical protein